MNAGDFIVLAAVAVCLILSIRASLRQRKRGCGCCSHCAGCAKRERSSM